MKPWFGAGAERCTVRNVQLQRGSRYGTTVFSESASPEDATMSQVKKCSCAFSLKQDGSCCTLIAEKYAETSPEILAGQGFSRLLVT
ncbi:hypothetical protein BHE74_00039376 [Ensete ventricosum]|uniref:Uncharacterized protein n=1 Tax=Ensete ventricosum TaxID=4639 RepID=A0A444G3F2_ENSVE|nr:hypothetical protein B296_00056856 [Ensete ventricosum]RWW29416.1 hypothetical protein GW17_00006049 [Ensete ventricosum]RWW54067.1 hypothetical protein BHE74_00039376 [Ensete ventricosum]RZS16709.1 hypothetical protein BHM03_00048744 [Ensete ventricosum]